MWTTLRASMAAVRQFRRQLRWSDSASRCSRWCNDADSASSICFHGPADCRLKDRNQMASYLRRKRVDSASLVLAAVLFGACSDVMVQPIGDQLSNANDRLTLKGRVCTAVPDPNGFPVKVVFIVDQSGSMCVSDPPGSQSGNGFCDRTDIQAIIPPGVTTPARVMALQQL